MDRSFDLVALLKQQPIAKTHKSRPTQFVSVAGGVQKRLETNIKNRKSSRLSIFDRIRNISKCESPRPPLLSEVQLKAEHRKQQLEKWKEEKDKKKKAAAAQKKKPFVAGVARRTTFGPPPPPRVMPSSSGRVTRSQALKQRSEQTKQPQSFAPSNATFKPPQFKNLKVPTLAPITKKNTNKSKPITFEPVLPKTTQNLRTTRSRAVLNKPNLTENKAAYKPNDKTKGKHKNPSPKPPPLKQHMFQSSSSSDIEKPVKKTSKLQPKTFQSTSGSSMEQDTKVFTNTRPKLSPLGKMVKRTTKLLPKTFQSSSSSSMEQDTKSSSKSSSSSIEKPTKKISKQQPKTVQTSSSSEQEMKDQAIMGLRKSFRDLTSTGIDPPAKTSMLTKSSVSPDPAVSSMSVEISTPRNVPKSESSSEEKLRSPKALESLTPEQIIEEAKNISPCVTMSRGKDNARKEMKKKLDAGLLDEDNSNMDSVNHFRRQLDSEITRITNLCEAWDKIFAQTVLPEAVQELVLTAVGQGRLLMSQKMQQFASLVERCARPAPGAALVTPADLHGFWDMVFMQVENVDMRFKKLEELRGRGWVEEARAPPARGPARQGAARQGAARRGAARPAARRPQPAAGPSRLRDMIAAARKAKKDQESQSSDQSESDKSESTPPECKTFEAGFFSISSPLKKPVSSAPATPANKSSLLKSVLSSEARKASASKSSTSFAMLRASLMSKNVDIEGVSPLVQTPTMTPVNLYATPARSILKNANPISSKKPEKLKMVLFHEESSPVSYASCDAPEEVKEVKEAKETEEVAEKENKPTPRRRSRITRQNAEDKPSPVLTRSRRKSAHTPLLPACPAASNTEKRSPRRPNDDQDTPKRSSRRRKSAAAV